jgi:hypothetical protein
MPGTDSLMYITIPAKDRMELWVADIDGRNRTKLSTAASGYGILGAG